MTQPQITIGGATGTRAFMHHLYAKRGWLIFVAIVVIVGCIALYKYNHRVIIKRLPSTTEYATQQVSKLQQSPPAGNASAQTKAAYYDQLYQNQILAGDYKSAVKTYESRLSISTSGVGYAQYFQLAVNYQKAGDKADALKSLDKAEQTIPPDDLATGFYRTDAEDNIAHLREVLNQ